MKRRAAILSIPGAAAAAAAAPAAEPSPLEIAADARRLGREIEARRTARLASLTKRLTIAKPLALRAIAAREKAFELGREPDQILQRLRAVAAAELAVNRVKHLDREIEEIRWHRQTDSTPA